MSYVPKFIIRICSSVHFVLANERLIACGYRPSESDYNSHNAIKMIFIYGGTKTTTHIRNSDSRYATHLEYARRKYPQVPIIKVGEII